MNCINYDHNKKFGLLNFSRAIENLNIFNTQTG